MLCMFFVAQVRLLGQLPRLLRKLLRLRSSRSLAETRAVAVSTMFLNLGFPNGSGIAVIVIEIPIKRSSHCAVRCWLVHTFPIEKKQDVAEVCYFGLFPLGNWEASGGRLCLIPRKKERPSQPTTSLGLLPVVFFFFVSLSVSRLRTLTNQGLTIRDGNRGIVVVVGCVCVC